jgi:hypothetical protein
MFWWVPLGTRGLRYQEEKDIRIKEREFEVVGSLGVKDYWVVCFGFLLLTNHY